MKPFELIDEVQAERIRQKLVESGSRFARDALEYRSTDHVFYLLAAAALENGMKAILFQRNWLLVVEKGKVKEGVLALRSKPGDFRSIGAGEALDLLVEFSEDFDNRIEKEIRAILQRRNGFAHFSVLDVTEAELLEDTRTFVRAISFLSSRSPESLWRNMKSVAASLTKDRLADRMNRLKEKVADAKKRGASESVSVELAFNEAPFPCPLCSHSGVLTGNLNQVDDERYPIRHKIELDDGEIEEYDDFPKKLGLRVSSFFCPHCLLRLEDVEEIQLASSESLVTGIPAEVDAVEATDKDFWREYYKTLPILEPAEE
jgi:hypothetical protein